MRRKKEKSNSIKGIMHFKNIGYTTEVYTNGDGNNYEEELEVMEPMVLSIDKSKVLVPFELIPRSLNNCKEGDIIVIYLNEDDTIKIGKDDKACCNIYVPKIYSEDEVLNLITELMHQVHEADDNIVVSDKMIDFVISPARWLEKFVKQ